MKHIYASLFFLGLVISPVVTSDDAHAQWPIYDSSVTLYSLDGPAEPITLQQASAQSQASQQSVSAASSGVSDAAVDAVPEIDSGWLGAEWSGRANIGASLQTGNTEQDAINADASVRAKWVDGAGDAHRASLKLEFNRENEDDNLTEDNRSLDAAYDYFFAKKWFLNSTLGLEQDEIEQIDLRTNAGIGLGHQPYEGNDLNLQYVLGPSYLREEFESGDSEDSIAGRWALEYDQRVWDDVLQLFHEHELLVPGDDTEAYLFDSKTGVRIPLKKGLVATGEVDFEWNNDPEPGVVEDDTTYSAKLGYEW